MTLLVPIMFGLTEFSLLWSARHALQAASYEAARAAAMPCPNDATREACARQAAERVLERDRYVENYELSKFEPGANTGDFVTVELKLPMTSAAPDLLAIIGISIENKFLLAETVTRRE